MRVGFKLHRFGSVAVLAGAVVLAILAPRHSLAECQQWDLTGKWEFWQSNKRKLELDLRQNPINGDLAGEAQFKGNVEIGGIFGTDVGTADIPSTWHGTILTGRMDGDEFVFIVDWGRPDLYGRGEYKGEVGPEGQLQGNGTDLAHPENKITWHEWAGRRANCMTDKNCQDYADKAMIAITQNRDLNCHNTGDRWADNRDHHFNWCMGLAAADRHFMDSEGAAREQAIKSCRSGIKAGPRPGTNVGGVQIETGPRPGTDLGGGDAEQPQPPAKQTATAKLDADVWDGPGAPGKPYKCGNLNCFVRPSDGPMPVLAFNPDGWYMLKTNRVPPGEGWVAADHLEVK
jgi:hypothetical protein